MKYIDNSVQHHRYTELLHQQPYRVCSKTVMDTSDKDIVFDADGVSNHYFIYQEFKEAYLKSDPIGQMTDIVGKIKANRQDKEYDCILGISGGVDSCFLAHYATKVLKLKVLLLHIDTGWNSDIAVQNINNIARKLDLQLHTYVMNWEIIQDLQRSFFLAGVPNLDIPQDHAFTACMYNEARKNKINYILSGGNMTTESILPKSYGYDSSDSRHLKDIHRKFGRIKLKDYPLFTLYKRMFYYPLVKSIKTFRPLDFIDYNKDEARHLLQSEYGWRDYGGKHCESRFTKFFQNHYLPTKFGFDKRKAHLSSLIACGQLSRNQAILELSKPIYDENELVVDREYFIKKLDLTQAQYDEVMSSKPRLHNEYKSYRVLYNYLRRYNNLFNGIKRWVNKI